MLDIPVECFVHLLSTIYFKPRFDAATTTTGELVRGTGTGTAFPDVAAFNAATYLRLGTHTHWLGSKGEGSRQQQHFALGGLRSNALGHFVRQS
jgi:hypothetical protein